MKEPTGGKKGLLRTVIAALSETNLIVDTISLGKSKFLGVTRLGSDKPFR
jgi:hypothetical protein